MCFCWWYTLINIFLSILSESPLFLEHSYFTKYFSSFVVLFHVLIVTFSSQVLNTCKLVYVYICMYVWMYAVYMYVCLCMCECMFVYMYLWTRECIYVFMNFLMYIMYVFLGVLYVFLFICMYLSIIQRFRNLHF